VGRSHRDRIRAIVMGSVGVDMRHSLQGMDVEYGIEVLRVWIYVSGVSSVMLWYFFPKIRHRYIPE